MLKRHPVIEALSAFASLRALPKKELRALARAGKQVEHPAGATIIEQGAGAAALHVVLDGKARVEIDGATVATLGPGDVFGEMAFLQNAPRSATVISESPVKLHSVTAWNVPALLEGAPELTRTVVDQMRTRRGD